MKKGVICGVLLIIILYNFVSAELNTCKDFYVSNSNGDKSLDITFLIEVRKADKDAPASANEIINSENQAKSQLTNLLNMLKIKEPFNEFINSKINIRYIVYDDSFSQLKCCTGLFDRMCSLKKVMQLASKCKSDEIINLADANAHECSDISHGYPGQYAVVYAALDGTDYTSRLILHEFGHLNAFLGDEYLYKEAYGEEFVSGSEILKNKLTFVNQPNCDRTPECDENGNCVCSKWRNIPGAGCYKGCTFEDWYREQENDIMRSAVSGEFGPVDKRQLRASINRYSENVQEPISIEVNKNFENFLLNKFKEKNANGITGIVPNIGYTEDFGETTDFQRITTDIATTFGSTVLSLGTFSVTFDCHDFKLTNKGNPKVKVNFNDIKTIHVSKENQNPNYPDKNSIYLELDNRIVVDGEAKIIADGKVWFRAGAVVIPIPCNDVLEIAPIKWGTTFDHLIIQAHMKYEMTPLNTINVVPEIDGVINEQFIQWKLYWDIENFPDELESMIEGFLEDDAYNPTENFVTEINGLATEVNKNLDEFGLALKTSLDQLGLEQLPNTGKPPAMILDIYPDQSTGLEVLNDKMRIWGKANLNSPYNEFRKGTCVENYPHNFKAIDYSGFNKVIFDTNSDKFAAIRISESFFNWFIANLWNEGYFCLDEKVNIANLPELILLLQEFNPEINPENFGLNSINYKFTPIKPPYIDYRDGWNVESDFFIENNGDLLINFDFDETISLSKDTQAKLDVYYYVPLIFEEPEATIPSDQGFSFAQSRFRTDIEKAGIDITIKECSGDAIMCQLLMSMESSPNNEISIKLKNLLEQEIKEIIAAHIDRAISEVQLNPVRDVNLDFGEVGLDYFSPGINLNFGEYTSRVLARDINKKYLTYEFDLIEKCKDGSCEPPPIAWISKVEEKFYKNGQVCLNEPTIESKNCINKLIAESGKMYHYFIVTYTTSAPYVTYNFNLRSWNSYKKGELTQYKVYAAADSDTYEALKSTSSELSIFEGLYSQLPTPSLHKMTDECTQVFFVKSKSRGGIEQGFNCMYAAIFDKCAELFSYYPEIVRATVKPRLRGDIRDEYKICHSNEYTTPGYIPPGSSTY